MFEALTPEMKYRVLTIRWADGLQLSGGYTKTADAHCCVFLLYPIDALLPGDAIREQTLDLVWASVYGPTWRLGNEDGSRYVILIPPEVNYPDRPFTREIAEVGKLQVSGQPPDNLWFYQLDMSWQMVKLSPQAFLSQLGECQFPIAGQA